MSINISANHAKNKFCTVHAPKTLRTFKRKPRKFHESTDISANFHKRHKRSQTALVRHCISHWQRYPPYHKTCSIGKLFLSASGIELFGGSFEAAYRRNHTQDLAKNNIFVFIEFGMCINIKIIFIYSFVYFLFILNYTFKIEVEFEISCLWKLHVYDYEKHL